MRFKINLGLSELSVSDKIEWGKKIVAKIGSSAFFAAPNPLPHPILSAVTTIINALDTALQNQQKGNVASTKALNNAELAFDNAFIELSHYVEDRANADSANGATIIAAANMQQKKASSYVKADFKGTAHSMAGNAKLSIKAVKGAAYIVQVSPDPDANSGNYTWTQAAVSTKATIVLDGYKTGSVMWFRYATVSKGVQSNWSDPVSVVIG